MCLEYLSATQCLESSEDDPMFDRVPLKTADEVIQRWLNGHTLCGMIVTQHEVGFPRTMPHGVSLGFVFVLYRSWKGAFKVLESDLSVY